MRAIADGGSFTAAAHLLGSSQPAISQMVRRLEDRVGTVLVERTGRSVRLTEAGEVLARHAAPVLSAIDAAEDEIAALKGLSSGRVRLMAFPSASATLVPKALAHVKAAHPGVNITFTEAEPRESLAALRAGECDLAVAFTYEGVDVGRGEEDVEGFVVVPLVDDEVKLAVPRSHPLAKKKSADLSTLDERRGSRVSALSGASGGVGTSGGFSPNVAFETEDYVAVMGLIAEGLGIAVIPDLILRTVHHDDIGPCRSRRLASADRSRDDS